MRFSQLVTISALTLSLAAPRAGWAGSLGDFKVPHSKLVRLSQVEKRKIMNAYIAFLVRYESRNPNRAAAPMPFERFLAMLEEATVPSAYAGTPCVNAGWVGERSSSGKCVVPSEAQQYQGSCSGKATCNPGVFGAPAGGMFCADKSNSNYTAQCRTQMEASRSSSGYREAWSDEFKPAYDSTTTKVAMIGDKSKDADLANTIRGIYDSNSSRQKTTVASQDPGVATSATGSAQGQGQGPTKLPGGMDTPYRMSEEQVAAAGGQGAVTAVPSSGNPSGASKKEETLTKNDAAPPSAGNGSAWNSPGSDPTLEDRDFRQDRDRDQRISEINERNTDLRRNGTFSKKDEAAGGAGFVSNDDDCKVSAALGSEYGCSNTRKVVQYTQVATSVGQAVGSVATQVQGQNSLMDASRAGTQSAALEAAAETQSGAANMQMVMGAASAAAGAYQIYLSMQHKDKGKEISGHLSNGGQITEQNAGAGNRNSKGFNDTDHGYLRSQNQFVQERVLDNREFGEMNQRISLTEVTHSDEEIRNAKTALDMAKAEAVTNPAAAARASQMEIEYGKMVSLHNREVAARNEDLTRKNRDMSGEVKRIGRTASGEQTKVAGEAMSGGVMSAIQGAQQLISGMFNSKAADQLKDAANAMKQAENRGTGFTPIQPTMVTPGDALAARPPTTINPIGAGAEAAPATDEEKNGEQTLGDPPNMAGPRDGFRTAPPAAPQFVAKEPGEARGGGGGGGMGGSTMPSSGGAGEDPSARLADNRGNLAYQGTGGGGGAYAGGGAGGRTADGGPDLSGMLAQFLPKKDEEGHKNGILAFGGERGPAADENYSLLDRKANLFDRIHQAYQDRQRRRVVGGL